MPTLAIEDLTVLRDTVASWRRAGDTIALVPTMGALHRGHLSLVETARDSADRVVVSVFVNPTQFGPNEDFSTYPRLREADLDLLDEAKVDAAWFPSVETMYPAGFSTQVTETALSEGLCGPIRPGHFSGVATVVLKLFNQVVPDLALFGEKDFQQLRIVQRMARDLDLPIEVRGVPTVREDDGLALSSRNRYLDPERRRIAAEIHAMLTDTAWRIAAGKDVATALRDGIQRLAGAGFEEVDYLEFRDAETLERLDSRNRPGRLIVAARLGGTRLIDNVAVPGPR